MGDHDRVETQPWIGWSAEITIWIRRVTAFNVFDGSIYTVEDGSVRITAIDQNSLVNNRLLIFGEIVVDKEMNGTVSYVDVDVEAMDHIVWCHS